MLSDKEIAERIAQLTGAINEHKNKQSASNFHNGLTRPAPRPPYFSPHMRFSNTWTPGQRHMSAVYNNTSRAPSPRPASIVPKSYNKKLVLNGNSSASTSVTSVASPSINRIPASSSPHKKLVLNNSSYPPVTSAAQPVSQPPPPQQQQQPLIKPVATSNSPKEVVIDGVKFIVKGRKLIRQDRLKGQPLPAGVNPNSHIVVVRQNVKRRFNPSKNIVLGQAPKKMGLTTSRVQRSKKGNMILVRDPDGYIRQGPSGKSLVLKSKRAIKRYCGLFTRYGKCPKGIRCAFVHDPNHRAICPRFLQDRCKKPANLCNLSHTPTPHIMPHCVHFQRGRCTNASCPFMHVRVRPDAPVCRAFAMEGYCAKGLQCHDKHIHVCPEFAETGKCSNANCRLPHVARRTSQEKGSAGVVRPGSWTSAAYEHAQRKKAMSEKQAKAQLKPHNMQEAFQNNDTPKPSREEEEEQGFVRLFDDSDDDEGWSQYSSRENDPVETEQLRFNDDDSGSDGDPETESEEEDEEEMMDEEEEEEEYEEYEIAEDYEDEQDNTPDDEQQR